MGIRKLATAVAASALLLGSTAAQAATGAQALSLRASTEAKEGNGQFEFSPLFIIGGIVATVAILEVTEVINIFGDDSDSD